MTRSAPPPKQGLYDPAHEHDSCGIGFVVDAHGRKSHSIVEQGVQVLLNLEHRGACGCEKNTGDGAGILMQMPHRFLAEECDKIGITLPAAGRYGAGIVFLPRDAKGREDCEALWTRIAAEEGMPVLGWRDLPTDNRTLGPTAVAGEPAMRQVFVARPEEVEDDDAFERRLYVLRRRVEKAVDAADIADKVMFYVPSFSHRTLVYKGMLIAPQLPAYFPDIVDSRVESALAMVHSRFSTNTFPNWARAHPYRYVCHNGEINTLRGNVNWMNARESLFSSPLFGDDLKKILPIVDQRGSDSGMFDNVLEMLTLSGRTLPHAVMMMIPEPWSGHESMSAKKAFTSTTPRSWSRGRAGSSPYGRHPHRAPIARPPSVATT
jgi:glutamate synthase (ferredoxin)